jgi:serine phosphatase RsbU (regulator of sigma subunit)/anti-sigma regulatory factor (Ser/Thr protein kinase)/anti-anti-sigma regulatory factor
VATGSAAADPAAAWAALDASTDGVAVFDADWTIVYINPAGAAVLDRKVSELLGANMWAMFPESVGTVFHASLLKAAESGGPVEWRAYYGPVQGWFADRAMRVGDSVVVVYTRVDDRHEAEATRQRLTAQVQLALDRSRLLLAASEAFTAATTTDDVVEVVANLTGSDLAPQYVALAVVESDGQQLRRVTRDNLPASLRERYARFPLAADLPASVAARTGRGQFYEDLAQLHVEFPDLADLVDQVDEAALVAWACVPVQGADGPLGVLVLAWSQPRGFDEPERLLISTLAGYVAQALQRVRRTEERISEAEDRYADTRAAVLAMQRSLLPDLPALPDLDLVAHYDPADAALAAGGDWYDVVPFADGRVALVIGDVVGHGPRAAAVMAQLRAVCEHLLHAGTGVSETLRQLDATAERVGPARAATVCVAMLTPDGELSWASHGHPPPLRVGPGAAAVLPGRPAAPLGTGGPAPELCTVQLAMGELLLLYTDGLVEQRGRDLVAGVDALAQTFAELLGPGLVGTATGTAPIATVREACAAAIERMTGGQSADDVTLLAARRRARPAPLELDVAARPAELRRIRRELAAWLDDVEVSADDWAAIELVMSEMVANSIEHGYRGEENGRVTVRAELDTLGRFSMAVEDLGRWRPPTASPGGRGRGLHLARSMMDDVELLAGDEGTRVRASLALHRAATFGSLGPAARTRPDDTAYRSSATRSELPVLHVEGPVDMATADQLRVDILDASRGGALPLLVDLDAVTVLASAGVLVLHDLARAFELRLQASPGTPARTVLALTGLDRSRENAAGAGP